MRITTPVDAAGRLTVCFVCTGNNCRSPIAEHVFQGLLDRAGRDDDVAVMSAGLVQPRAGQTADERTIAVLAARGMDASDHRARQFLPEWFEQVDLVVALDRWHAGRLRALAVDSSAVERIHTLLSFDPDQNVLRDVADPYFSGPVAFEQTLTAIEQASPHLLDHVTELL